MKLVAAILACIGLACTASALWLFAVTCGFFNSPDYQPGIRHSFSYGVGLLDLDGGGIFSPSLLLLAVGLFFLKFALNLWRDERTQANYLRTSISDRPLSSGGRGNGRKG